MMKKKKRPKIVGKITLGSAPAKELFVNIKKRIRTGSKHSKTPGIYDLFDKSRRTKLFKNRVITERFKNSAKKSSGSKGLSSSKRNSSFDKKKTKSSATLLNTMKDWRKITNQNQFSEREEIAPCIQTVPIHMRLALENNSDGGRMSNCSSDFLKSESKRSTIKNIQIKTSPSREVNDASNRISNHKDDPKSQIPSQANHVYPQKTIIARFHEFAEEQVNKWNLFLKEVEEVAFDPNENKGVYDQGLDLKRKGEVSIKILQDTLRRLKKTQEKSSICSSTERKGSLPVRSKEIDFSLTGLHEEPAVLLTQEKLSRDADNTKELELTPRIEERKKRTRVFDIPINKMQATSPQKVDKGIMTRRLSDDRWIDPTLNSRKVIMLDKFVSTSSRLAKMISQGNSSSSIYFSMSKGKNEVLNEFDCQFNKSIIESIDKSIPKLDQIHLNNGELGSNLNSLRNISVCPFSSSSPRIILSQKYSEGATIRLMREMDGIKGLKNSPRLLEKSPYLPARSPKDVQHSADVARMADGGSPQTVFQIEDDQPDRSAIKPLQTDPDTENKLSNPSTEQKVCVELPSKDKPNIQTFKKSLKEIFDFYHKDQTPETKHEEEAPQTLKSSSRMLFISKKQEKGGQSAQEVNDTKQKDSEPTPILSEAPRKKNLTLALTGKSPDIDRLKTDRSTSLEMRELSGEDPLLRFIDDKEEDYIDDILSNINEDKSKENHILLRDEISSPKDMTGNVQIIYCKGSDEGDDDHRGISNDSMSLHSVFDNKITQAVSEKILDQLIEELTSEETFINLIKRTHTDKPDIDKVKEYIQLLFSKIQSEPEIFKYVEERLNTPIGMSNLQRLLMCSPCIPKDEFDEQDFVFEYFPVLDIKTYINLEEKLRLTTYTDLGMDSTEMEQNHIFHKMIFDSLNETLDYKRLYGLNGIPMVYTLTSKIQKAYNKESSQLALQNAQKEVENWCQMRNGILSEKEPDLQNIKEFDAVEYIREEKMFELIKEYVLVTF